MGPGVILYPCRCLEIIRCTNVQGMKGLVKIWSNRFNRLKNNNRFAPLGSKLTPGTLNKVNKCFSCSNIVCSTAKWHRRRWTLPIAVVPLSASSTKMECRQIDSYVYMTFNLIGFHTLINSTNLLETIERWALNWIDAIILWLKSF